MPRLDKPLLFSSASECEQAFYDALEAADAELVAELWADDADVVCVHPGGSRLVGATAVRASWVAILANGAVHARAVLKKAIESDGVVMTSVIEEVMVGSGRQQQVLNVIATNAYARTPVGWKMILHHASPAPSGEPASASAENHGVLH